MWTVIRATWAPSVPNDQITISLMFMYPWSDMPKTCNWVRRWCTCDCWLVSWRRGMVRQCLWCLFWCQYKDYSCSVVGGGCSPYISFMLPPNCTSTVIIVSVDCSFLPFFRHLLKQLIFDILVLFHFICLHHSFTFSVHASYFIFLALFLLFLGKFYFSFIAATAHDFPKLAIAHCILWQDGNVVGTGAVIRVG